MLTLTHCEGQSIKIGDDITIIVRETSNHKVVLSYDAPRDISILRDDANIRQPKKPIDNGVSPMRAALSRLLRRPPAAKP